MHENQLFVNSVMLLHVIVLACITGVNTAAECSASSRGTDLETCLQKIRSASTDVSKFWFGSGYATRCPPQKRFSVDCFNPDPTPKSLVQMMFWPGTFQSQTVDRYLDLTFTSGPGEYKGCDYNYKQTTTKTFTIDPLSTEGIKPWHLRSRPAMKWTSKTDEQFTLVVIDVGYGFNHGFFMNIPGNDLTKATMVKPYHGPRNARLAPNPYAFLLFNQTTKNIKLSQHWKTVIFNPMTKFNISDFMTDNKLQGPVAINWIMAGYDPWSVQQQKVWGFMENCVPFVQRTLQNHSRPFLPSPLNLKIVMRVSIQTPALTVKLCCKDYTYPAKTVTLDPIGNGKILAAEARSSGSMIKFEFNMNKMFPNKTTDFSGQMYTLIAVDPDVPRPTAGTQSKPLVHMLVVNIKDGDVKNGKVLRQYAGPMPPDSKPHYYYFLLYEQKSSLDINEEKLKGYLAPNSQRFLFDINTFTTNSSLTLVGASWMVVANDEFVNGSNMQRGRLNETQFCTGKPGYAKPCPVGGASHTTVSLLLLSFVVALAFNFVIHS